MSSPEKRNSGNLLITNGASLILGAAATLGIVKFTEITNDQLDYDASPVAISKIQNNNLEHLQKIEDVNEENINPEVLKLVEQSLVKIELKVKPEYEQYDFPSGICNGFIIRDAFGTPFVVTARHCVPGDVISQNGKKIYSTTDPKGDYVYNILVTDINKQVFEMAVNNFYISQNYLENDVALLQFPNPSKVLFRGLPLNLDPLKRWDSFYRISSYHNGFQTNANYHFYEEVGTQYKFYSFVDTDLSCAPGTSGSAIVNKDGEVVAVVANGYDEEISKDFAIRFGFDLTAVGKKIATCGGTTSKAIKGLIRNQ
ncbi:MAG TPA: serine protease [Patescibacteria group bacterium]